MEDLFDALDRFGRSVVETVPGAEYRRTVVNAGRLGNDWAVHFIVDGVQFCLNVDKDEAWLFHDDGSIHYADGDWRALLAERFGGGA
jgi:hypothetical protein